MGKVVVTIRRHGDASYRHEVDVTGRVGTADYERAIAVLRGKLDSDRGYWLDSTGADLEHARRNGHQPQ